MATEVSYAEKLEEIQRRRKQDEETCDEIDELIESFEFSLVHKPLKSLRELQSERENGLERR